jgi:hypothetical protein
MQPARPLRDVLTDLVGEADAAGPADVLAANGHADLPDELVAEAVGSFADTSPIEVAEHLSTYVMANSPVPQPDAPPVDLAGWLDAVTTAPSPTSDIDPTALLDDGGGLHEAAHEPAAVEVGDLHFGRGDAAAPDHHVSTVDSFEESFEPPADLGYDTHDGTDASPAPDLTGLAGSLSVDDATDDMDDMDDVDDPHDLDDTPDA